MTADRIRSSTLAIVTLAVLGLPYAAPVMCALTGQVHARELPPAGHCGRAGTPVSGGPSWSPSGVPDGQCDFGRCSATLVAPMLTAPPEIPSRPVVSLELRSPLAGFAGDPLSPLTPPPQA